MIVKFILAGIVNILVLLPNMPDLGNSKYGEHWKESAILEINKREKIIIVH